MKIKYVMGFNWGNLANRKYPFEDGMNLIVGDSGSGKSTLLDLMQTVMTAAHDDLKTYNAGQTDDTTEKKDKEYRTFASYLLGADQMRFSRKEAIGIVAIVFENERGKKMSGWILGKAALGGSGESKKAQGGVESMGICFGYELEPEDFLITKNDGTTIVRDKENLHRYLKETYKKDSEVFSSKKDYLRRLYGAFLGKRNTSYPEAQKAAKAFVKYIHPTQTDNVHKFVRDELLDKKNLESEVKNLKEIILTYKRIEKEAEVVRKGAESLKKSTSMGSVLIESWGLYYKDKYIHTKRKEVYQLYHIENDKKNMNLELASFKRLEADIENAKISINTLTEERDSLSKTLSDSDTANKKALLEEKIKFKQSEISRALSEFEGSLSGLRKANSLYSSYMDFLLEVNDEIKPVFSELSKYLEVDYEFDKQSVETLDTIYAQIKAIMNKDGIIYKTLEEKRDDYSNRDRKARDDKKSLDHKIDTYNNIGKTVYPNQDDLDLINATFHGANAKPLCEFLELLDDSWQQAVEGYIGFSRFSIVVSSSFEADAAELMLSNKRRSRIIQGTLLLDDMSERSREVRTNSILKLMEFSNPIVEAFMFMNYSNVVQVGSKEELRRTRRGLTKSGLGSSKYTMYSCLEELSKCYIGEKAKTDRHNLLILEQKRLQEEISTYSAPLGILRGMVHNIASLSLKSPYEAYNDTTKLQVELDSAKRDLDALDLGDIKEIQQSIDRLKREIDDTHLNINNLTEKKTRTSHFIEEYDKNIKKLQTEYRESVLELEKQEAFINRLLALEASVNFEEWRSEAKKSFKETSQTPNFYDVKDIFVPYRDGISHHNRIATQNTLVQELPEGISDTAESFNSVFDTYFSHTKLLDILSNNILIKKQNDMEEQRGIFDKSLKEEFCNRVYAHILEGKKKINNINRILGRHKFGEESFKIKSNLTAEFKEYYEYFENLSESGMYYQHDAEDERFVKARERLEELLLGDTEGSNMKELHRIADYRNYYDYDIHKILNDNHEHSVSLNKFATDSGGQAETSYYVIRSIAAFSAFDKDIDNPIGRGIGFLLVDEGFKRIDDIRPGKILNYLLNDLGFQIITAMPPRNEGVFADFITGHYDIFKEIINPSPEDFNATIHAQYSIYKRKPVQKMIDKDKKQIQLEFSLEE